MNRDEELYDIYLDACLDGRAVPPDAFCAEHPDGGPALRRRIEALHRMLDEPRAATPAAAAAQAGLPFERLGEFRLIRPLDRGGMGVLYLAEQEPLGRAVALKVIRPELLDSPVAAERFRREALAVAKLRHEGIVGVYALGEEAGVRYLAMELVPGKALEELLKEASAEGRTLPPRGVAEWMRDLARALAYAHGEGIIHRDIKPSNIRVTPEGKPRLLDFGIARDERWRGKTVTETFAGSPLYSAPEQLLGATRGVDGRADVYSLGATLYQCLTGRVPHDGESLELLLRRLRTDEPVPPRRLNNAVPRDLEVIALKALERDPARRYPTMAALADDLEAFLGDRPIRARPAGLLTRAAKWSRRKPGPAAALATALVAAVALAIFLAYRASEERRGRRDAALRAVEEARRRIGDYRARRAATEVLEAKVKGFEKSVHARYFTADEDRLLEQTEGDVLAARRERETAFYEVLDLLRRADQLDPEAADTDAVRADLYLEKWKEGVALRDALDLAFYRRLVERYDREGRHVPTLRRSGRVSLASEPPGAEIHLFRCVEQAELVPGGDRRQVPVPWRGMPEGLVPGAFAVRILGSPDLVLEIEGAPIRNLVMALDDKGAIRRFDRLLRIDGADVLDLWDAEKRAPSGTRFEFGRSGEVPRLDVPVGGAREAVERGGALARVWRDGAVSSVRLAGGLRGRETAAPFYAGPQSLLGETPLFDVELDAGAYVAILRKAGFEERRVLFLVAPDVPFERRLPLFPDGSLPDGFVRTRVQDGPDFLIMEREVTAQEYLDFLNAVPRDEALLPRSVGEPIRLPESGGRYGLLPGTRADWPAFGVTFDAARAYAVWRSGRDGRTYDLPTYEEWVAAATGGFGWHYPFGDSFRPKWVKSCYARPEAGPEPILRYPIDESLAGVFDLAGGVKEWVDAWYDEPRGLKRMCGGSWAQAIPDLFKVYGEGYGPQMATSDFGFRLVTRGAP
ncbi:MAG TPA: bifunctional serine/threonine-protein kinase/formylglycine-generating enzyme family protein [Planctomycetota bacterium]|nr:bifunctional serine/threonine-protein kinase/formylglycine-generating enzyme family protein [Planctomycetota bacterium]